jgi:hypothetical protein
MYVSRVPTFEKMRYEKMGRLRHAQDVGRQLSGSKCDVQQILFKWYWWRIGGTWLEGGWIWVVRMLRGDVKVTCKNRFIQRICSDALLLYKVLSRILGTLSASSRREERTPSMRWSFPRSCVHRSEIFVHSIATAQDRSRAKPLKSDKLMYFLDTSLAGHQPLAKTQRLKVSCV